MKKIFVFGLLLVLLIAGVSAIERSVFIEDYTIDYSYEDAEEGERFTLTVKITNDADEAKTGVVFELEEDNPFDLESESVWNIGTIGSEEQVTGTFRIDVDDDTLEEEYDLEFTLEDDDDDFVDEFRIEVGSENADLIVGDVKSTPSVISADLEDVKLKVRIDNLGGGDAKFVRAKLELPKGFSPSSSFADSLNLGVIEAKGNTEAEFFVNVDRELDSKSYEAVLILEYKDGAENRESRLEFDIPVKGRPLFSVVSSKINPENVVAGSEGSLSIEIMNVGEEEGKETSVRVFENADFPIDFDEKTNFVGSMKPGEAGTAIFKFEIENNAKPNTYLVKVQTRTLNEGDILVEEFTIPFLVSGEENGNFGFIIAIVFMILLIVLLGYLLVKVRGKA